MYISLSLQTKKLNIDIMLTSDPSCGFELNKLQNLQQIRSQWMILRYKFQDIYLEHKISFPHIFHSYFSQS